MLVFIRYDSSLGDSAIYVRLRNGTQFWDFVALTWLNAETADCRIYLTEQSDTDPSESLYSEDITLPSDNPIITEAVLASTGEVLGSDITTLQNILEQEAQIVPYVVAVDVQSNSVDEDNTDIVLNEKTEVDIIFTVTRDGNPVDLESFEVYFTVKKKLTDRLANALIHKIGVASDTNKATFSLTATDTTIPPSDNYIGELSAWDGTDCVLREKHNVIVNKVIKESLT